MAAACAALRLAALALAGALLLPWQWAAVRLSPRLARPIPLLFHRLACRLLGIRVAIAGMPHRGRPLLVLANHTSWLDIVVLSSVMPVVFVAKSEVAGWPLFGMLARLQRTVFVDRQRRHRSAETAGEMAGRLGRGDAVVLFAEGTSSDHNRVLPFRSTLVGAVGSVTGENGVSIQPVAINYARMQGLPIGRARRPRVAWYGGMTLPPHLWAVACAGALDVELAFGDPVAAASGADRKRLAADAEVAVRAMIAAARGHGVSANAPRTDGDVAARPSNPCGPQKRG